MQTPLVSVIIVNWNGKGFLEKCIPSLQNQTYPKFELIVVDNNSKDGSTEYLKEAFPSLVKVIHNPTNSGFAGGCNIGIRAAKGEFIATLNNDTVVDKYWIEELVKAANSDSKVGMCASKIYLFHNPKLIDSVGIFIYRDGTPRGRGRLEEDIDQYETQEEVLLPTACGALYRKDMLDEIGLFDEGYFMYIEDVDLGLRGRLAGWKCFYVPTAIVYHHYSGSSGAYSPFKVFLVERNRVLTIFKIFPLTLLIKSIYYTLLRYLWQGYAGLTGKGATGQFLNEFSAFLLITIPLRAYITAFIALPHLLKQRREIKSKKRVSNREIYSWLKRYSLSVRDLSLKE